MAQYRPAFLVTISLRGWIQLLGCWMFVTPISAWTVATDAPSPPLYPSQNSFVEAGISVWIASKDTVVRVLDDNTIKLQKTGIVMLQDTKLPVVGSGYQFPPCLDTTPNAKLKQLLPPKTVVDVLVQSPSPSGKVARLYKDERSINEQLVRMGYAKAKSGANDSVKKLQKQAETNRIGIFKDCESFFVGDIDATSDSAPPRERPPNPGDRVGCSDFRYYEDALKYYEKYLPFYGDVARLDRDNDGVPCPKLPHTANPELYRVKKASR